MNHISLGSAAQQILSSHVDTRGGSGRLLSLLTGCQTHSAIKMNILSILEQMAKTQNYQLGQNMGKKKKHTRIRRTELTRNTVKI